MTKPKSKNTKIPKSVALTQNKKLVEIFGKLAKFSIQMMNLVDNSEKSKFQIAHEWNYKSIETLRRRLSKGITYTSSIEDVAMLLNIFGYELKLEIVKK